MKSIATIADKLAEAHAERDALQEKIVMVDGRQVTLYSPDNQHWFSKPSDIQRWQAAKAARALNYEHPVFNLKAGGTKEKIGGHLAYQ